MNNTSSTTSAFKDRGLEAALDTLAEAGLPAGRRSRGPSPTSAPPDDRELARIRGVLDVPLRPRQDDARALRAATSWPPSTTIAGEAESVPILSGYVRLAGALGLTEIVIHPIPNPDIINTRRPGSAQSRAQRRTALARRRSCRPSSSRRVRVTLENLPYPGMP